MKRMVVKYSSIVIDAKPVGHYMTDDENRAMLAEINMHIYHGEKRGITTNGARWFSA